LGFVQIDQSENGLSEQFERLVTGHFGGCRIDRQNAMRFIGENDAGRCVAIDFLRQLFALRTGSALGDVSVAGGKAGKQSVNEKRLVLHKVCVTVRASVLKALRLEFFCLSRELGDMALNIARSVLAAAGRNPDQRRKMRTFQNRLNGQAENIEETLVPDAQTQVFVKDADALRHACDNRPQVSQLTANFDG
jgi:hypothetical protein